MKKSKFLPLALALLLTIPMASAATNQASSEFSLGITEWINITVDKATQTSATTVDDTYENLTISTPPNINFTVITNKYDKPVYLSAKCPIGDDGTAEALGVSGAGSTQALKIAFSNNAAEYTTQAASVTGVENALGSSAAVASNPNVIAFNMDWDVTATLGGVVPSPTKDTDNRAKYVLKNGQYNFNYAVEGASLAGTFSPHDEQGTYKTTLTLSVAQL